MSGSVLLLVAACKAVLAAEPALLTLDSELPHTFKEGSVLRVPKGQVGKLVEVRLPTWVSATAPSQSFKLHLVAPGDDLVGDALPTATRGRSISTRL